MGPSSFTTSIFMAAVLEWTTSWWLARLLKVNQLLLWPWSVLQKYHCSLLIYPGVAALSSNCIAVGIHTGTIVLFRVVFDDQGYSCARTDSNRCHVNPITDLASTTINNQDFKDVSWYFSNSVILHICIKSWITYELERYLISDMFKSRPIFHSLAVTKPVVTPTTVGIKDLENIFLLRP